MKDFFKEKKVLLVGWGCENENDTVMYQTCYIMLKKIFPKILTFDSKKNYFLFGKNEMNKMLLDYLKRKNFDMIIFAMDEEEFYPETILKAREIQQNARTVFFISDDDTRFDHYSRYYALLFDNTFTLEKSFIKKYNNDGIKDAFFIIDYNTYKLEPMDIPKKYDVVFIGRPKADRHEIIKFLMDNGIKIALFGWDWYKYPELKNIYKGPLNQGDYAKTINESKINLSLTKSGYAEEKAKKMFNYKARIFEPALCKAFQMVEYFKEIAEFLEPDKEAVFFKSKEELLEKVRYYIRNEKQRQKIANNSYKKVTTKYNREKQLKEIYTKIFFKPIKKIEIPKINKKLSLITKKEVFFEKKKLNEILKNIDYVYFSDGKHIDSEYKNNFQVYSLKITKKNISCCDYYLYSKQLGDYLRIRANFAFKRIGKKANRLININQLMMKRDFFLENLEIVRKIFNKKEHELLSHENTAFVSIQLTRIEDLNVIDYEDMKKSFDMAFIRHLFSLIYQKKIFTSLYLYKLFLESLDGKTFILKNILESIFNRHNWDKLNLNKSYVINSIFEKFTRKS